MLNTPPLTGHPSRRRQEWHKVRLNDPQAPRTMVRWDRGGGSRVNESGARPARFLASGDRSRPVPAGAAVAELAFCLPDLPDVRDFATVQAVRGGMSQEGLAD